MGRGGQTGGVGSRGTRAEVTAQVQASNEGTDQVEAEKGGVREACTFWIDYEGRGKEIF